MNFPYKIIDLTHTINTVAPSWEGDCGFQHETVIDYASCTTDVKFKVQKIHMYAGFGTHMDAPAHCIVGGKTIDTLELDNTCAPCCLIDVSGEAHESYRLSAETIQEFERQYGKIRDRSFVIIRTGWDRFWNDPFAYRNHLKFPTVSLDAARFLLKRNIVGLGIDTLSPDTPDSGYPVHQTILGAGNYIVENVANSSKLPPQGSFSLALPIRIEGGTEAPMRLIGLIPHEVKSHDQ